MARTARSRSKAPGTSNLQNGLSGCNNKIREHVTVARSADYLPASALCSGCRGVLRKAVGLVPCGHLFCGSCAEVLDVPSEHENFTSRRCTKCASLIRSKVRIRVVDELMAVLENRRLASSSSVADSSQSDTAAAFYPFEGSAPTNTCCSNAYTDSPRFETTSKQPFCCQCNSIGRHVACDICGTSTICCARCLEDHVDQCEKCAAWFCSWCAARHCRLCRRPHVCWNCSSSPLRECPEHGGRVACNAWARALSCEE